MDHVRAIDQICNDLAVEKTPQWLLAVVGEQRVYCYWRDRLEAVYRISTAKNGICQLRDSEGTPLGLHKITEKIGDGAPWGTVFIGRKSTGKIFTEYADWEEKGYVTSRILRLRGLQEGYNSGGNCDSYDRFIYIHGTARERAIGTPCGRGCINMLNSDVIALYRKIAIDSLVLIRE
ncbi:MAG: L,D-transpeptidase [Puniceicoccales bacterium]|jgi:hypothetical protein|nr:L,D-transpeptidase [Puniceicoccales bacterium]